MILFLDFDGVQHPAVCAADANLMCRRTLLEALLRECPQIEIVVSSTWRESRTLPELQEISPYIGARIVGVTPMWEDIEDGTTMGTYVRQAEIEALLRQSSRIWEPWVALDDQPWLFRPFRQNLVRCDPATGLTEATCAVLRTKPQVA